MDTKELDKIAYNLHTAGYRDWSEKMYKASAEIVRLRAQVKAKDEALNTILEMCADGESGYGAIAGCAQDALKGS